MGEKTPAISTKSLPSTHLPFFFYLSLALENLELFLNIKHIHQVQSCISLQPSKDTLIDYIGTRGLIEKVILHGST